MVRRMRTRSLVVAAVLLFAGPAFAKSPRLTLFISVDSLGSDLFWRMKPRFKAGLLTLSNQGAWFPTARYDYAETVTAAGHTTLVTGTNPSRHGIVSNKVMNRQTGKLEPVFADPSHPPLEAPLDGSDASPVNLLAETVGDRLRMATGARGKVISVALKGRSAIAMGGRLGQAWWFNEAIGRFVTGTYYLKEVPAWMKAFNDKKPADAYQGKDWPLLAPPKEYVGTDDRPFEADAFALGRSFPHPLSGGLTAAGPQSYAALASSPMGNELLVNAARAALDGEQLGKDDVTDLLAVSFSAFDRVTHLYGPYSFEAQDALLRLDRQVGDLIAAAEKAAGGRANLTVVLSADHGGAAVPEEWAAMGLDGVRVNADAMRDALKKELNERFKGEFVTGIEKVDIYLDGKVIADKKLDAAAVRRAAAAWVSRQPDVIYAVARDDLDAAAGPYAAALRAGYHPDRSGDVLFTLKPYHVLELEPAGTSHGTPYAYDAEVPVLLLGKNVKPGFYPNTIRAVDIAPTLAALMEIGNPAMCEGTARAEALSPAAR